MNIKIEKYRQDVKNELLRLVIYGDGRTLRGLATGTLPIFGKRVPGDQVLLFCAPENWPELSHDLLVNFEVCFYVELLSFNDQGAIDFVCQQAKNGKMLSHPTYWKLMRRLFGAEYVIRSVTAAKWQTEDLRAALMDRVRMDARDTLDEVAEVLARPFYPWRGLTPRSMSRRDFLGEAKGARVFDIGLLLETVHQNDEAKLREPVTDSQW
ncbi:hypothetical protein [Caldimonas sp. KR1-144]|uniref:hypothetical protein n=1 Tax=Caldimonas sp. KR1-144 TaxID=3400911 RepID=UPI003C066419